MTVEALKQFMLLQAPLQAAVSPNGIPSGHIIDPSPGIGRISRRMPSCLTVNGGPTTPEIKSNLKHKKKAEVSERKTIYAPQTLIE